MALALVCTLVGSAHAGPSEALDHIRDAIDVVDDEGGKCKKDVMEDLEEIKGLLKEDELDRAAKRIRSLKKDADRCPAKVEKLLSRAGRALERDDDRDDRKDDRKGRRGSDKAPARLAGLPYSDWSSDCRDQWMINEIARHNTSEKVMTQMRTIFGGACESGTNTGAANYPNGTMAKSSSGDFYYPNGTMAKSSSGDYYYPNGTMAKSSSGSWYYPNGTMAYGSGTWYYKNGTNAGGYQAVTGQACERSQSACAVYKYAMQSDVSDWREFSIVQLETRAPGAK